MNTAISLKLWICLGLAAMTLLAYQGVFANDFVDLDDGVYVTENPHVLTGLSAENMAWAWQAFDGGNWHPLVWHSLQLDAQVFGMRARGFHITNLALHLANVLLLFLVLAALTREVWPSALVAALFAVHPLHVESVAWIAERKDVLSTLFWMLTLAAYAGYVRQPGLLRYVLVLLAFALGLLCKAMLVTLPCVLLLLDVWPLRRLGARNDPDAPAPSWWRVVGEKVPLLTLAAAVSVVTILAQRQAGALASLQEQDLATRLTVALGAVWGYLLKTLWPVGLVAFYPQTSWVVVNAALGLAVILMVTVILLRQPPGPMLIGWLWFLGTLVPVSGIVQVGDQALADRYTYIPHIGLFILLVWGGRSLLDSWRWPTEWRGTLAGVVLVLLVFLTMQQVRVWRNGVELWEHALRVNPDNWFARAARGRLFLNEGKRRDALEQYQAAVALASNYRTHYDLGVVLLEMGRNEEAARNLARSLEYRPLNADARYNLGRTLNRLDRLGEAEEQLREADRLAPNNGETLNLLGLILLRRGQPVDAEELLARAVRLQSDNADAWYNLSLARGRQGKAEGSLEAIRRAVALRPTQALARGHLAYLLQGIGAAEEAQREYGELTRQNPGWKEAFRQEAWRRATGTQPEARDPAWALELARQVVQAEAEPTAESLDVLGAALAAAGRFPEAVQAAKQALERGGSDEQRQAITERLRGYEKGQALQK